MAYLSNDNVSTKDKFGAIFKTFGEAAIGHYIGKLPMESGIGLKMASNTVFHGEPITKGELINYGFSLAKYGAEEFDKWYKEYRAKGKTFGIPYRSLSPNTNTEPPMLACDDINSLDDYYRYYSGDLTHSSYYMFRNSQEQELLAYAPIQQPGIPKGKAVYSGSGGLEILIPGEYLGSPIGINWGFYGSADHHYYMRIGPYFGEGWTIGLSVSGTEMTPGPYVGIVAGFSTRIYGGLGISYVAPIPYSEFHFYNYENYLPSFSLSAGYRYGDKTYFGIIAGETFRLW